MNASRLRSAVDRVGTVAIVALVLVLLSLASAIELVQAWRAKARAAGADPDRSLATDSASGRDADEADEWFNYAEYSDRQVN